MKFVYPIPKSELIHEHEEFIDYNTDRVVEYIGPLSGINILVGANNSRKSRFLRWFLKTDEFFCSNMNMPYLRDELNELLEKIRGIIAENKDFDILPATLYLSNKLLSSSVTEIDTDLNLNDSEIKIISNIVRDNQSLKTHYSITGNELIRLVSRCSGLCSDIRKKAEDIVSQVKQPLDVLRLLSLWIKRESESRHFHFNLTHQVRELYSKIDDDLHEFIKKASRLELLYNGESKPNKIYIPIPRGAVTLSGASDSLYMNTVKDLYNIEDSNALKIYTGQDLYTRISKDKSNKPEIRKRFKNLEVFIGEQFFDSAQIELIARSDDKNYERKLVHINIKGEERGLHNVGDGIHSIITLLHPIFLAEQGSWIMIEEPELHLHPGFLSILFNTISHHPIILKKELTFFITTHSNHLLDGSLRYPDKVSIFSLENNDKGTSLIRQIIGADNQILDLLGVYNSSVFMANCSIWVEGVSDRRYLKAFLHAYAKAKSDDMEFIEGYNYTFFEYAGSNLTHYLFDTKSSTEKNSGKIIAHFSSNRTFLLRDHDTNKESIHKILETCDRENDGFHYCHTGAIEIENVLTSSI